MSLIFSKGLVGCTGTFVVFSAACHSRGLSLTSKAFYATMPTISNNTLDLTKIGKNLVRKVPSMEEVPLESLWAENTVVLTFLRRFGCLFCRQGAKELSTLTPLLASKGVKNVAVGLEDFGLEDFVNGGFFNGDLYLDSNKKTYQDIGYKRFGMIGTLFSLFGKSARDRLAQNREENLPSNLKGDGMQSGGTLVITKGGTEILLDYRQENPADHVELSEILRVLGIDQEEKQ